VLRIAGLRDALQRRAPFAVHDITRNRRFEVRHDLSERQVRVVLAGGLINDFQARERQAQH
jgi:aconitate hydratase